MSEHRPQAHVRPSTGWINDPIGPVVWHGRTHLFHQFNPAGGYWDRPHWGHVTSHDLVTWRRRPVALTPDPAGPDADGCFSGSVVVDGDEAVMFYTGVRGEPGPEQRQLTCVARSRDPDLDVWVKDPDNPVVTPPDDLELLGFRDPYVWREDGRWWMLTGAGIRGVGGAVLLHTSEDLRTWVYRGPMLTGAGLITADPAVDDEQDAWTGAMWECPTLMRTQDGDVLVVSIHDEETTHHPLAIIGRLHGGRFLPERVQRLDLGPDLYAPCLLREASGRTVMWAWSWEARTPERQRQDGWAGTLSLPRRLDLVDGRVHVAPLTELVGLRGPEHRVSPVPTAEGWLAAGAEGESLDLEVVLGPAADRVALRVFRSPALEEVTTVGIDRVAGSVWLDRDHASRDPDASGGRYGGTVPIRPDETRLRIVLDRSIVEVFIDGRAALTARVYPSRDDSRGIEVIGSAEAVDDMRVRAWPLRSIWDV
jgi:beta-fructofuranosidase